MQLHTQGFAKARACGACAAASRCSESAAHTYSPPEVDRIWLRVYHNKIPIYPIFYRLKRDYNLSGHNADLGISKIRGTLFGSPSNEEYSMLGLH